MFDFFKAKPEPQPEPEEKHEKSIFSTHMALQPRSKAIRESYNASIHRTVSADAKVTVAMDAATDSVKAAFSYNFGMMPTSQLSWYGSQGFIGYQACAILAQNWLVGKTCSVPAKDALRKGYDITANDGSEIEPELMQKIIDLNKKYKVDKNLKEFVKFGRTFGIRIAFFKIKSSDPEYYAKPFNIDGVTKGSYQGIVQVDPYWCAPELDQAAAADPMAIDFYEPTFWRIGSTRIHKSHLIIFKGDDVADILKPSYYYGGISIPQKIYERVYAAERTANEAPQLVLTKRTKIYKTDLNMAVGNQQQLETVLNASAQLADNYGVRVIGKDDEITQTDTALSDLDAVIMTQYQLVAAVANVPATKLLGTSPKGFGASGEYEESNYREELETIQENDMKPLIERHLEILNKSDLVQDINFSVMFRPLDSLTELEQAQVNNTKAQTDQIYVNAGAIDGEDIRIRLSNDPKSGYNIEIDETQNEVGEEV